ncbi:GNAT family N-acetyltransferase [Flavobacterium hydatis]|uniref:GNAT family N-acetyltransferase n=1 Tax=Flavobacterium hydatis TaxID=991 RepID=A0ABX4CHJ2_FLAHY|nr:GNAT family N-acetyltransferase [Flavobacterium hydatis]OXA94534.1 GNAT family N-acetyltransferase [Flavobacterium hydatis]
MKLDFTEFPRLETQRLVLRSLENQDFELIHKLHSDPVVNSFVGRDNSSSLEKAQAYIIRMNNMVAKNECIYWVITTKENNDLIGSACLWNFDFENKIVEIGYEMLPDYQGKGFMTEALREVVKHAFEEINSVIITAFPSSDNVSSVSILKKLNFQHEDKPYNNTHQNVANLVTYTLRKV